MDYYQGVVVEYLRADRSLFINTEYCIQLKEGNPDVGGPNSNWYCDAVAIRPGSNSIFLCEISYAKTMYDLRRRLEAWNENWQGVHDALIRDSKLKEEWSVRPWLFVPQDEDGKQCAKKLVNSLKEIQNGIGLKFTPLITTLEMVQPWKYPYDRKGERIELKPDFIPVEWRG